MPNKVSSADRLQEIWKEILKLSERSRNIKSSFTKKELDISDYMSANTVKLIFTDIFTIVIGVIIASVIFAFASFIGLSWLVSIFYILVIIGMLYLFFVPIALITGAFVYLVYFDGTSMDEAAYICILLFILYRITTIFNRKKEANLVKDNEIRERKLSIELNNILNKEIIPIAHEKYIFSIETIMDDTDIKFLPERIVENVFNDNMNHGEFEEISSFEINKKSNNDSRKSRIFKSLRNNSPSSEHVEVIELDIS